MDVLPGTAAIVLSKKPNLTLRHQTSIVSEGWGKVIKSGIRNGAASGVMILFDIICELLFYRKL